MILEERLKQIQDWGVPHLVVAGHCLKDSTYKRSYPVAAMHGDIPEVLIGSIDHTPFFHDTLALSESKYASALSKLTEYALMREEFIDRTGNVDTSKVEFHAIYNPHTYFTHYFALPNKISV